ncbi:MAG: 1-aminocyclopropane-1-carboxylate deaminase/D-cysteine desulfhydrase [Lachnospiraceae bacterium]
MQRIHDVENMLAQKPRQSLGFYPTPLHKLDRLSEELGVNLFLKRDDLSGMNVFGGNKVRKLEYLLGDAVSAGCDTIITYGAVQSNHAMQTVAACRRCGLFPILYLVSVVEPDTKELRANLLLDRIFGAEVHIISIDDGESEADAEKRSFEMGEERATKLRSEGKRPYIIPLGGASPVGTLGFIGGFTELSLQLEAKDLRADFLFHSTGTGGTLAGLVSGKALSGVETNIISVTASPKDAGYEERVCALAENALSLLGVENANINKSLFSVSRDYFAPGYEIPNEKGNGAIRRLARTEGILTDTVYSGKALAGMLDYIESGRVPRGSNVIFWHTGGTTALFAENEIIGDLAE